MIHDDKKIYMEEFSPDSSIKEEDFPDPPMENNFDVLNAFRLLINCNSLENISNTPDFILAEFLEDCFKALNKAISKREEWYGRQTRND